MRENKGNTRKELNLKAWKVFMAVWTCSMMFLCSTMNVYAADYGKKAGTWMLDQIFWIGLVILAIALIGCLIKKAWIAAVITFVAGGLILVIIKDPGKAVEVATNIFTGIFW